MEGESGRNTAKANLWLIVNKTILPIIYKYIFIEMVSFEGLW